MVLKDKDKGPASNYLIERLLSAIIFVVFMLAIAAGILSFIRLNNIIFTAKTGIRPDKSLLLAKEISNHMSEAENSVKSYSLTRNEEDMLRFYKLMDETGDKMEELKSISLNDEYLLNMIDSLDILVSKKFNILDQLLMMQDEALVNEVMQEVMQNIRQQENVPEPQEEVQYTDTVTEEKTAKKDNFFRRLFQKKNKDIENREAVIQDTILSGEEEKATIAMDEVSRQVEIIQQQAIQDEERRKKEELALFHQDKLVMEKIRQLMQKLERREDEKLREDILEAEAKASEVKSIILTYGLAALILLLLVAISIYTYIRRNNEYRRVLRKAKADAEELALKKEGFLANMSHEIKTPMNIISGYLDLIMQGKLDKSQRDKVDIVKKSSNHLIQLLNNLLDLSKMQAGKLVLLNNEFEPREIIRNLALWFKPLANEKGIKLESFVDPRMPLWIRGDPVRLRQILFNLIGNAIKFTSSGKIAIHMAPVDQKNGKILTIMEVSDTGIGISKNDQQRIFEQFEQVHTSNTVVTEGSGLGLAITLQLVRLMEGEIELKSIPGEGATFRITIPFWMIQSEDFDPLPAGKKDKYTLNGLNVLVVDDEAYNRKLVRMMLEKYHCNITEAESGQEAVEIAAKDKVDIILMDIRMAGMSGQQAARVIREKSTGKSSQTYIIALSAEISDEDYKSLKKNGIDDFLAKPFEEVALIRTILRLIHNIPLHNDKQLTKASEEILTEKTDKETGFDLTPLINASNADEAFLTEMATLFINSTSSGLQQIKQNLDKQEWFEVGEIAHKISGPCRHLKAMVLHGHLKELEGSLKGEIEPNKAEEAFRQATIEFEKIREAILSYLQTENSEEHE